MDTHNRSRLSSSLKPKRWMLSLTIIVWTMTGLWIIYGNLSLSRAQTGAGVEFIEVAGQRGIILSKFSWGLAWADFNGDGYFDVYTNNHTKGPALYQNDAGQFFTDIAGDVELIARDLHGVAWGDYDNDGDPDLYQSAGNLGLNIFYHNDSGQSLTNIASDLGIDHAGSGRGVAWADYDRDGDLDFFITSLTKDDFNSELFQNQGDGTFVIKSGAANLDGNWGEAHIWGDYNNDGWLDLVIWSLSRLLLFRNNGDGTFSDRSAILDGVTRTSINQVDWVDYDNDGDLDLYVSRSGRQRGFTWNSEEIRWNGSGAVERGFDFELTSPGGTVTLEIYNLCGYLSRSEIFVGSSGSHPDSYLFTLGDGFSPEADGKPSYTPEVDTGVFIWRDSDDTWHVRFTGQRNNGRIFSTTRNFDQVTGVNLDLNPAPPNRHNELWENLGNENFVDVTNSANVTGGINQTRGTVWGDFDNDGDLDLYLVNQGHFINNEPNTYLMNNGDKTFSDMTASAGLAAATATGYGNVAAAADYNQDGFLDIALANGATGPGPCGGPFMLFENQGNSNHWLQVQTIGTQSNRDGIGAKITLVANGQTQYRPQLGGQHGYAQDSSLIHFGLADVTIVDTLLITWPSGVTETYTNLGVDQIVTLVEDQVWETFYTYQPIDPLPGEVVTFTATITPADALPPITYTWQFDDGMPEIVTTSNIISHTYEAGGTYDVDLIVANAYRQRSYSQTVVVVIPLKGTSFTFQPAQPVASDLVTFTAAVTPLNASPPITYSWLFGDGTPTVVTTANIISHIYPLTSEYTVTLTASNSYGQVADIHSLIVTSENNLVYETSLYLPIVIK